MAAPQENLLSLRQLTGSKTNTFTKQRGHCVQNSVNRPVLWQNNFSTLQSQKQLRVMHLQQCWQKLKERELAAQQQNRELLQQFEKAQDTLREMLVRNAAMKTIRMEYEQYLEERYQCWQQQLTEKTQAAKALKMGECLKSPLNDMEEVTQFTTHRHLNSQGPANKPQKVAATQDYNSQNTHLDNNHDSFSHLPDMQSSWLTHPQSQTVRLPIRVPYQPQASSHFPQYYLPHSFQRHHLTATTGHHHLWPRQDALSCASLQTERPCSCTAVETGLPSCSEALWGQLYTEEPLPESRVSQDVVQEGGTSRAPSTKSGRGGGSRSSHLSQELDVKPVRLSSESGAESTESRRDSSQGIREKRTKREKRGRSQCTSSEEERHSQESSMTSTAFIIASVAVQSSETDTLSEKCSTGRIKKTRRSRGQGTESQGMEMIAKEGTRSEKDNSESQTEESQCLSEEPKTENAGNQSADNKSDSGTERSKGNTTESENGGRNERKKHDSSSSEQSSADGEEEEKGHEKHQEDEDGEEDNAKKKENSQAEEDVEEEEDDNEEKENSLSEEVQEEKEKEEDNDVSVRKNTLKEEETEEEDDVAEECEDKDRMKNENCESSASSEEEVDEDEIEKDQDKTEDEEEDGEYEEEQRGDKAGKPEESDSDHSINLSQENRHTKMHFTPEEEKRGNKTGSSEDSDSNDFNEDDIESLLAPQEQKKKEEKDLNGIEKPKAICERVNIFQVEDRSRKTDHKSDSDEFDHFYD